MLLQVRNGAHLAGFLSHGFTLITTVSDSFGRHRAFYGAGYDLMLFRPTRGLGAYGILGAALGLSTDTGPQKLAMHWTFGGGIEWRAFPFFGLGVEARYRLQDRGPKGFWNPTDIRKGVSWNAGVSVRWPRRKPAETQTRATPSQSTAFPPMATAARPASPQPLTAPANVAGPAGSVVRTALDALGTPYRWGGTAANGFDCSGLVQWAYNQYGVQLPRTGRAQAGSGSEVPPVIDALVPGDILLFAAQPGSGVTHVGMYVGEGKFIHSSSTGVRLSLLDYSDPNGSYWLQRWVGARRVIQ